MEPTGIIKRSVISIKFPGGGTSWTVEFIRMQRWGQSAIYDCCVYIILICLLLKCHSIFFN